MGTRGVLLRQVTRRSLWHADEVNQRQLDEYLSQIRIGDREGGPVLIAAYDESWPGRFQEQRARIKRALGETALRIDHIGSTSVPGLAAKPIIDVQVSVRDVQQDSLYVTPLEAVGYILRIREPGHRLLRTPASDVHVHVWPAASGDERRHLLFRDWLRRSRQDREAYEALKRKLAVQDWEDRQHYAEAKGPLIAEIMQRAEAWATATGWST
jgi:GrpB-like predicted nucleotidyltransferase (UPF0157 family)